MVVAGIPQPRGDHAAAIARMGLDMQNSIAAYATRTSFDLTIRIGIHSGSVVAGVIGATHRAPRRVRPRGPRPDRDQG